MKYLLKSYIVMVGRAYTRRHRARDVRRAQARAAGRTEAGQEEAPRARTSTG
jgi:hypothetical protein